MRFLCLLTALFAGAIPAAASAEPVAWFTGAATQAQQAVALLRTADTHGLEPSDYDAEELEQAATRAARGELTTPQLGVLERRLTRAMERYLADLHGGRLAASDVPHGYAAQKVAAFDANAVLRRALSRGRVEEAAREAAPGFAQYERLREALATYRALADHLAWSVGLPPLPAARAGPPKLEAGASYAGLRLLRARLIALGDLPAATPEAALYDEALANAVRAFQQRHGLAADGVIGRATLAQLDARPSARARQIELMLERLRWTPLLQANRMVVINIPEFVLRAYEVQGDAIAVRATMKIIVGKALATRTPLFIETMRLIEFQPFWNVPPSIARGEVVPRLRRDPGWWEREGFEFVVSGSVEPALTTTLLDEVIAGRARIRQRPGPRNALGDIKFVFPNRQNIYLHHTPSIQLFTRDRRDFSHGCIRVEDPVALARFVMDGMAGWDEPRIRRAMNEDQPATVRLERPLPVLIAYGTTVVKSGRVHFYEDIYGDDRRLDAALRQRRAPLAAD